MRLLWIDIMSKKVLVLWIWKGCPDFQIDYWLLLKMKWESCERKRILLIIINFQFRKSKQEENKQQQQQRARSSFLNIQLDVKSKQSKNERKKNINFNIYFSFFLLVVSFLFSCVLKKLINNIHKLLVFLAFFFLTINNF